MVGIYNNVPGFAKQSSNNNVRVYYAEYGFLETSLTTGCLAILSLIVTLSVGLHQLKS